MVKSEAPRLMALVFSTRLRASQYHSGAPSPPPTPPMLLDEGASTHVSLPRPDAPSSSALPLVLRGPDAHSSTERAFSRHAAAQHLRCSDSEATSDGSL